MTNSQYFPLILNMTRSSTYSDVGICYKSLNKNKLKENLMKANDFQYLTVTITEDDQPSINSA